VAATVVLCAALLAVLGAGEVLSQPAHRHVGSAPPDLDATPVDIQCSSGAHIRGWAVPGREGGGVVLLLHGVRADRREMIDRARFLKRQGFGALLIDLPAHGESDGDRITFGWREADGVRAALRYLSDRWPKEQVGVIGVSLGAASLVLSHPTPPPAAVVLESMYPTIADAVSDRLRIYLGAAGPTLAPVLLTQLPLRLGISPAQLRPAVEIADLHAPLLVAAGSVDRHTTLDETQRIFDSANGPKELWIVENAAHVDLHARSKPEYEARIGGFLALHLRKPQ